MNKPRRHRIVKITLDERSVVRRSPDVEHERAVAIFDLLEENDFAPVGRLRQALSACISPSKRDRLVFDIRSTRDKGLGKVALSLGALPAHRQRLLHRLRELLCRHPYRVAVASIEAIDMGRRALHNEGSDLLQRTARRQESRSTTTPRGGCSR